MAPVIRTSALAIGIAFALGGCGDVTGFGGQATPLAELQVEATGDPSIVQSPGTAHLAIALIWGEQWLSEPLCFLPPESQDAAAALAAGCRDPFGFAPNRVAANVDVELGTPATLRLFELPGADVMVGDVTARVAYGSLVLYDDRDGSGTLDLHRFGRDGMMEPPVDPGDTVDVIYGASFLTMTRPDRRIAFREGAFNQAAAFYPRSGCDPPPKGFSVLDAGGFSAADALAAALAGKLPPEDPATCATATLDSTTVQVPLEAPDDLTQLACTVRRPDGSVRYHEPPADASVLDGQTWACVHVPGDNNNNLPPELIVAKPADQLCKGLDHYTLRGCEEDPACANPQWDRTASAPSWWPCPVSP